MNNNIKKAERVKVITRRRFICGIKKSAIVIGGYLLSKPAAAKLKIRDNYSRLNKRRPLRPKTDYIILHTTEGKGKGAIRHVKKYGLANYLVDVDGQIHRIIHHKKIARHAGRSMWEGKRELNNYSIGIEVVGYHNKDITKNQYNSVRELIKELKKIYGIPDEDVLPHSMVAYSRPSKRSRKSHRGRKRCGMLFAKQDVREKLGLKSKSLFDPDVRARRLTVGDKYLASVLFGSGESYNRAVKQFTGNDANIISKERTAWFIARDKYDSKNTIYEFPDGRKVPGDKIKDWGEIPPGTLVDVGEYTSHEEFEGFRIIDKKNKTAWSIAGDEFDKETTIYFLIKPFKQRTIWMGDELKNNGFDFTYLDTGTKILVGYVYGGHVKPNRSVYSICGKEWNYPSTFFRFPDGTIKSGDEIDQKKIPVNTLVLFRK